MSKHKSATVCQEQTRSSIGCIIFNVYETYRKYLFIYPPRDMGTEAQKSETAKPELHR